MPATRSPHRKLYAAFLLSGAAVAGVLQLDTILVNDVALWVRLAIPAALAVGFAGTLQANRIVCIASRSIAWIGIGFYLLMATVSLVPGEMTRLAGYPPDQPASLLVERLIFLLALGLSVVVAFAKLTASSGGTADGSNQ